MNLYHTIYNSTELSEIGHYLQTRFREGFDVGGPDSYRNVKVNEFPDFIPKIELEFNEGANQTDCLSHVLPFGLLVSDRCRKIFEAYKLPPHHFYEVPVFKGNTKLSYYWFHCLVFDFWDYVDTENSMAKIHHITSLSKIRELVPIKSKEQIREIDDKLTFEYKLKFHQLKFKSSFPNYDFYRTQDVEWLPIISEKLKMALHQENMTGFHIKPFDRLYWQ